MVNVKVEHLSKKFEDIIAVDDVSIDISEGKFFTLLGPSGCGKTTILRIIAGLTQQDTGDVYFDEELMNNISAHKRNTGLVFQTFALWPHLNVFENIAFGLDFLHVDKKEKNRRVLDVLKLVGLEGMGERSPNKLSGGQQQRVALARALVIEPRVLLLDEPLSNLDAKLRVQMRTEIKRIQKSLGITTIYVTHDQEEALSISDEIAIIDKGSIQQIGIPRDIYEYPENRFVANFIGLANFIKGKIEYIDKNKEMFNLITKEGMTIKARINKSMDISKNKNILASVRPEAIKIYKKEKNYSQENNIKGNIKLTSYLGDRVRYQVKTEWKDIFQVDIYNPRHKYIFKEGEKVIISFDPNDVTLIEV
ncbi:MAG: ABC transporter ATP-binding protein [Candidatus Bathyarchaeia archaeon]